MTNCQEWGGRKTAKGYGLASCPKRKTTTTAHRLAWENHAKIMAPPGMVVRHTCDNPSCVNPDHLILGTYTENERDKWTRNGEVAHAHQVKASAKRWSDPEQRMRQSEVAKRVNAIRYAKPNSPLGNNKPVGDAPYDGETGDEPSGKP